MSIKNVALVGATGNLGSVLLDGLLEAKSNFNVSVLQRQSSKSTYHGKAVKLITVDDSFPVDELTSRFRGQDAVIVTVRVSDVDQHKRIAEAAVAAGVKRFIPADFGSCDPRGKRERELLTLFEGKVAIEDFLHHLTTKNPDFSWTSLVSGHFFDWGLKDTFLHIDIKARTADVADDGNKKSSLSTLAQVARATVKVLEQPDITANKALFVQSFCVSQNQIIASLEKATGDTWQTTKIDSEDFIAKNRDSASKGDADAIEHLVWILGAVDGNWESKPGFAMHLLGLREENLDDVVAAVVREIG